MGPYSPKCSLSRALPFAKIRHFCFPFIVSSWYPMGIWWVPSGYIRTQSNRISAFNPVISEIQKLLHLNQVLAFFPENRCSGSLRGSWESPWFFYNISDFYFLIITPVFRNCRKMKLDGFQGSRFSQVSEQLVVFRGPSHKTIIYHNYYFQKKKTYKMIILISKIYSFQSLTFIIHNFQSLL